MNEPLTADDEGKRVVSADGEEFGTVTKVDQGVAHVDPDPELSERVRRRLDQGGQDDYTLQETDVTEVTDERVVLRTE